MIAFDFKRLNRTAVRITRGLFFIEKGHRLPDEYHINATHLSRQCDLDQFHPELGLGLAFRQYVRLVSKRPRRLVAQTFGYQWAQSPYEVGDTAWLLWFYGRPEYLCTTFRAPVIPEGRTWEEELRRVQARSDFP
jgi:hypothetical protein